MKHKLSTARKIDVSLEEFKVIIQQRFQYQLLIPQTTPTLPVNEIISGKNRPSECTYTTVLANDRPRLSGDFQNCGGEGHKERRCRSKKREEANKQPQENRQEERPEHNSKVLANSCDYTSFSARDCRHRAKGVSAFRNVSYEKQISNEDQKFCKEFKSAYKRTLLNEVTEQPEFSKSSESKKSVLELITPRHLQKNSKSAH